MKTLPMMAGLLCVLVHTAAAQTPLALDAGARVRVSTADGRKLTGQVEKMDGGTVVIRGEGESTSLSLPVASLTRVELSRGMRSRKSAAWSKAKWGALIGAVPGAISLGLQHEEVGGGSSVGKAVALGIWSGGLFGGGIGAIIGAANPGENWERIK